MHMRPFSMMAALLAVAVLTSAEPGGASAPETENQDPGPQTTGDESFTETGTAEGGDVGDAEVHDNEGATDGDATDPQGGHDKPDGATE